MESEQGEITKVDGFERCGRVGDLVEHAKDKVSASETCELRKWAELTVVFFSSRSHTSKKYFANLSSESGTPLILMRSLTATR